MYGLAPTEIIYHIALSYILGFNEDTKDIKHNFRQLDALPYAKEGTLPQKLDELFSGLPLHSKRKAPASSVRCRRLFLHKSLLMRNST